MSRSLRFFTNCRGRCGLYFIIFLFSVGSQAAYGQLIDSFSDGDFTTNPAWSGDTQNWEIITSSGAAGGATNSFTLRLNASLTSNHTDYLSLQRTDSWGSEQSWGVWMGRYSTSGTSTVNQSYIWLWASEADLTSSTVDGYRLHIGGTMSTQPVLLERIDNGVTTSLITSTSAIPSINTGDYGLLLRVTRTTSSDWTLYSSTFPAASGEGAIATDMPSAANTPNNQGSANDATYTDFSNGFFGFMAMHQGSGTSQQGATFDQLYFDISANAPLPVELTSFSASVFAGRVTLKWHTATETNNFGFEVQRKKSDSDWQKNGFVPGHGTTTQPQQYEFVDETVKQGGYFYRLKQIDTDGSFEFSQTIAVQAGTPETFYLGQNYPNPFNPQTKIQYSLAEDGLVNLTLFDLTGRVVRELVSGRQSRGEKSVVWDGTNSRGEAVASGIYFYTIRVSGLKSISRRMLLLR